MNIKKIGLTALAGSLVATSAFAGEMSVAGSAKIAVEHTNGGAADTGKTFSMGNQLTFSGSGELDNGLNVSLSFVLDQNDDKSKSDGTAKTSNAGTPFDSSSDSLGTFKFSGEGGSSATSALDATAAGDIWDQFDDEGGLEPSGVGSGDNMMMYTTPSLMEGLSVSISYLPTAAAAQSAVGYSATYTGVEGLSVSYATGDSTDDVTDATVLKGTYAYGPVTVAFAETEYDSEATTTTADQDFTAYSVAYTVSDEISIAYKVADLSTPNATGDQDQEVSGVTASYTAGGMTISGKMINADNIGFSSNATKDQSMWELAASFAF